MSFLDADRSLGTVGDGQTNLCFQLFRHIAFDSNRSDAVIVYVKDIGRNRITPAVPLAFCVINCYAHLEHHR
jgi:hypothetical protein